MFLRYAALAATLVAAGASVVAAEPAPVLEMGADGEIQIATDGRVSGYLLKSTLPPVVANLVDRDVHGWLFEPVLVNGQAVVAKTTMHLQLKAEPTDKENYKLRIVNVQFGEPRRTGQVTPPRYPEEAIRDHVGAKVMLGVRIDDKGNVVEVHAYQTNLDVRTRRESEAEHYRRLFEKASIAAAQNWHYDLSETINGKLIGTTAIQPVAFSLRGPGTQTPHDGEWKAYDPGPVHPVPWLHGEHAAENSDLASLQDGQALSLESHFRLKEPVIGKTL